MSTGDIQNNWKDPGDAKTKRAIIRSYTGAVRTHVWAFLTARAILLPLNRFHEALPKEGVIAEVGCGHGIVCQYLARRAPSRQMVGFDMDLRRTNVALKTMGFLKNLEYRAEFFGRGSCQGLTGVVVIGVFCLLKDRDVLEILRAIRRNLSHDGFLLISDIPDYYGDDWVHRFHLARERFLGRIGFTVGQGVYLRSDSKWEEMLKRTGFSHIKALSAPVFMHRTFNWVCQ
jgi:SAM-dependent methyltransferase